MVSFLLFLLSSSNFPLQNSHEGKQAQLKKVAPSLLLPSLTGSRGELQRRDARRESSRAGGGGGGELYSGEGGRWEKQEVSLQYIPTHIALLALGNWAAFWEVYVVDLTFRVSQRFPNWSKTNGRKGLKLEIVWKCLPCPLPLQWLCCPPRTGATYFCPPAPHHATGCPSIENQVLEAKSWKPGFRSQNHVLKTKSWKLSF